MVLFPPSPGNFPEPERRICYSESGGTPLGQSPFWRMTLPDADNCGEWQITTKGRTWVVAKLVGNERAAVLFSDVAVTIDGLQLEDPSP